MQHQCGKCKFFYSRKTIKPCGHCEKPICGGCSVSSIFIKGRFCNPTHLRKAKETRHKKSLG